MSKIICDICGTTYSDTESECPICGCAKDLSAASLVDELLEEELTGAAAGVLAEEPEKPEKSKRFGKAKKAAPVVEEDDEDDFEDDEADFDDEDDFEDDEDDDRYEDDEDEEDDEDDEEEHKSNAGLVIALVLVILMLIAVSAFILVKYFLPNFMGSETTAPAIVETTEAPTAETTELRIPCESLALTSGGEIVLEEEGANWLINVMALPENTTDALVYASSDENVVTVNEQGKLTAVGEGIAVITITCGEQEMKCTVTCNFTQETTAPSEPEETTAPSEPEDTTEPGETEAPTEPQETEAPTEATEPLKNVDLAKAINYKELTFNGPNQAVVIKIKGLNNSEVKWSSEDEKVATVDENGRITNTGVGTTYIVVKYGEQEFKIKIICRW